MNALLRYSSLSALGFLLLTAFAGCVVPGGGYDQGVGVSYGVGFSEPIGYDYGGWGPGYRVGPPPRGGWGRPQGSPPHSYRAAPASRQAPSIPQGHRPPGH
jgi:hypothetical protein